MDELVINGKQYVKATEIAKDLGYTSDYVGQLCRGGKVDAQRIGRSWYVVAASMKNHRKNRYRSNQVKSKAAVAEYRQATARRNSSPARQTGATHHLTVQHYDHDDAELIPPVAKRQQPTIAPETARSATIAIKSERKKRRFLPADKPSIRFSGNVPIATAEEPNEQQLQTQKDTTTIEPKPGGATTTRTAFRQRIAMNNHAPASASVVSISNNSNPKKQRSGATSLVSGVGGFLVVCAIVLLVLVAQQNWIYEQGTMAVSFGLQPANLIELVANYLIISN